MENLLSIDQAAERLGKSRHFIRERIRDGALQCVRLDHNSVKIEESALAKFVEFRKSVAVEYALKRGMRPVVK